MLLVDVGPESPEGLAPKAWRDQQGNMELALVRPGGNAVDEVTRNLRGPDGQDPRLQGDRGGPY